MICPTSFFIHPSLIRQFASGSWFSIQLEPERKGHFTRSRRAEHDFSGIVDVSPLRIGLIEQVSSSRGESQPLGEMVGPVSVQGHVIQELGRIPIIGVALADKAKAASQFKRRMTDLANVEPKICACCRHIRWLCAGIEIAACDVLKTAKARMRVGRVEVDVEIVLRVKQQRELSAFGDLASDGLDLVGLSRNWCQNVTPFDVVRTERRVSPATWQQALKPNLALTRCG